MNKKSARMRRAVKLRCKLKSFKSTRLVVHRTSRHIYAQIISSDGFSVLVVASTLEKKLSRLVKYTGNKEAATLVGTEIAKRALKIGVQSVSFDRSGFQYHGRIQALADAARKVGLNF
ncbi:50S ribosomal protein L18 [Buchnera aphidicola (Schlechtendalia chinensis)]|uniref:Large ribosomal subunit protein uL18 n=1 Tax=Buchnera aphidicola subsp. Schlechtendalia chinensis TaxID=118110 RepID=A0A172WED8_BUCSC|nr:50S ribosomal protein L18 [Buchnera aphidicola]ANF17321.1 50S ribosomal protein L18 [Buchnera aphidicola (Schlechtendalia chinensis)]